MPTTNRSPDHCTRLGTGHEVSSDDVIDADEKSPERPRKAIPEKKHHRANPYSKRISGLSGVFLAGLPLPLPYAAVCPPLKSIALPPFILLIRNTKRPLTLYPQGFKDGLVISRKVFCPHSKPVECSKLRNPGESGQIPAETIDRRCTRGEISAVLRCKIEKRVQEVRRVGAWVPQRKSDHLIDSFFPR